MELPMRAVSRLAATTLVLFAVTAGFANAQGTAPPAPVQAAPPPPPPVRGDTYSSGEIIQAGHKFFGAISRDLAGIVEHAVSTWGLPNGYILGQEGGGAA
jgi:hypothetical protein